MTVLEVLGCAFLVVAAVAAAAVAFEQYLGAKEFARYGGADWNLRGRVVLITGASSGIGEEMAKQCASAGAHLVLAARRADRLQTLSTLCLGLGAPSVVCVNTDVSVEADCKRAVEAAAAKHDGVIDVVFANAGLSMAGNLDTQKDLSIFQTLMAVNFFGVLWTVAYALPYLKRARNAKIIILSSVQGRVATPGRSGYNATKYALHGLGDTLRQEVAPYGMSVLMVCPGPVRTDINASRLGSEGQSVALDMAKAMPVNVCVRMILDAARAHARTEMFLPLQTVGPMLSPLLPRITDLIVQRKQKALHKAMHTPAGAGAAGAGAGAAADAGSRATADAAQ